MTLADNAARHWCLDITRAKPDTTLCHECGTRVTTTGLLLEDDAGVLHTPDRCAVFRAANGEGSR